jgi:hypothetical protein
LELRSEGMKYLGIYQDNFQYFKSNFVTHQGALWFCEMQTKSRPGTDATWRLAMKSTQR